MRERTNEGKRKELWGTKNNGPAVSVLQLLCLKSNNYAAGPFGRRLTSSQYVIVIIVVPVPVWVLL